MRAAGLEKVFLGAMAACLFGAACSRGVPPPEPPRLADETGIQPYVLRVVADALAELEADPRDAARWRRLGLTYRVNFIDLAVPCLEEAVRLDPRDARAWYHLGGARAELGELDGALAAVDEALALQPDVAHLHWSRGFWLLESGRTGEAVQAFERSRELQPDALPAAVGRARAALQQDDAETAARLFEELLRRGVSANEDYVRANLATAYRELGRPDDAAALGATQAVRRPLWDDPWAVAANEHRALRSWVLADAERAVREGRTAWALERLRGLARAEPENPAVQRALGRALHAAGRIDEAVAALLEAARLGDDSYELHVNLVGACLATGRRGDALRHARAAVRLRPDAGVAQLHLGRAAFLAGEPEEAVVALRQAAALGEDDPRAQAMLGEALLGLGRWREAREVLLPVTRSAPGIAAAQLGLARAEAELGNLDEARVALERARSLAPGSPGIEPVALRLAEVARR